MQFAVRTRVLDQHNGCVTQNIYWVLRLTRAALQRQNLVSINLARN